MRTTRLFTLLDLLRTRRTPISADRLAEQLGVSGRTVYRDIATLQALGAPVRGEAGLGYQLERGFFLPPLHFDSDEIQALMLGLRMIAGRGDAALRDATARVSAKIAASQAHDDGKDYLDQPLRAVLRVNPDAVFHLLPLRLAVREQRVTRIVYRDLRGKLSDRVVRLLGLTVFDEVWLFTAWCETRADFRNFRVDLVQEVDVTDAVFRHQKGDVSRTTSKL